ncbi:MAG TPA: helix-turn-helix domain-containing protein [Longimicrobium sp.]|nr:helix-turn-helix domain-containing protein [Longimicrobium sp.]
MTKEDYNLYIRIIILRTERMLCVPDPAQMRPVKTRQSSLLSPLNQILGTEANVRVLRVLASAREPLSRAEAARRAQLDPSGVRRALDLLIAEGIVEHVGAGARRLVRLREAHPLADALRELFAAEGRRTDDLARAVRQAAERLSLAVPALWMMLPEAEDGPGMLRIDVLAGPREVDRAARELRNALADVERRFDVTIEVRAWTAADLRTLDEAGERALAGARPLLGLPPEHFIAGDASSGATGRPWRSHADLDRRSLALARAVGDRIAREPALIDRARRHIEERLAEAGPAERKVMEEWKSILDTMTPARLRAFLADPGERATRLRQSLPFAGVLSPAERERLLREAGDDPQPA